MSEDPSVEILKRIQRAKSPYSVLGLNPNCQRREIKKAYYKLSKLVHPDRCKLTDASLYFQIVNSAYELLNDQESRRRYDSGSKELWKFGQKTQRIKEMPAVFADGIYTVIDANEDDISPEEIVGVFFGDAENSFSRFKNRRFFSGKRAEHEEEENNDADSDDETETNENDTKKGAQSKFYQSNRFYQSLCYAIPLGISCFLLIKNLI